MTPMSLTALAQWLASSPEPPEPPDDTWRPLFIKQGGVDLSIHWY